MMLKQTISRATTALKRTFWHVTKYAKGSVSLFWCISFLVFFWIHRCRSLGWVWVSPGKLTGRVLQETDLVFPSGLHPTYGVCQSTLWQLLVPPTTSAYHLNLWRSTNQRQIWCCFNENLRGKKCHKALLKYAGVWMWLKK